MEFISLFFSFQSFVFAALSFFCCAVSVFAVRFSTRESWLSESSGGSRSSSSGKKEKSCNCCCSCNSSAVLRERFESMGERLANGRAGEMYEKKGVAPAVAVTAVVDRQTGASMMEQLVPEITTHALSYLDYTSLCRLSMTNSLMRKAANDDNAWKALYHKDFTMEQNSVKPANGWKAYYAATKAVMNVNAEFFNIIREKSITAMSHFWLNADYVKCIHASGELFTGYTSVMESWQIAFSWEQQADKFHILDVQVRVLGDMAWVTMRTYVDTGVGPCNVTNVFECHNGRWYMVHHHCSASLMDEGFGEADVIYV